MTDINDDDYYRLAYELVHDAIYDQLLGETLWFFEDEDILMNYDLSKLQAIIRDIMYTVDQQW